VRCIYIDESGRSHEKVAVVLGIAAHGDTQLLPAERAVYAAIQEFVPPDMVRKGYVYHTTELLSRSRYESIWNSYTVIR